LEKLKAGSCFPGNHETEDQTNKQTNKQTKKQLQEKFVVPSANNLSAFASEIPLIVIKCFLGENATDSTVWNPASCNFLISPALIPQL
jgi:hypothetical protein